MYIIFALLVATTVFLVSAKNSRIRCSNCHVRKTPRKIKVSEPMQYASKNGAVDFTRRIYTTGEYVVCSHCEQIFFGKKENILVTDQMIFGH